MVDRNIASIPKWRNIDEAIEQADGDKGHIAQIKTLRKQWIDRICACDGRIKTLRGFLECQLDKLDKGNCVLREMIDHTEKTGVFENQRKNLGPVFSGKFTEKMAETKTKADQDFQDAMVAEIKQNVKEVRILVEQFNTEFDLLKEVMTKSLSEKIHEVREDERQKAEEALKKQALEHQTEAKKAALEKEEALKNQALEHQV